MAALTADVHIPHKGTPTKLALPATGADVFYAGAIVYIDVSNNTGQVQVASLAATDVFAGICAKQTTTTAAGDLVELYVDGIHALPIAATAATDIGAFCMADVAGGTWTDNPADLVNTADATEADNDVLIGPIIGVNAEESTLFWVRLTPGYVYNATQVSWVSPI